MGESSEHGRNRGLRSSALWGKGGRGFVVTAVAVLALGAPLAATAAPGPGKPKGPSPSNRSGTFVSPDLQTKAKAHPDDLVKVIIQSSYGTTDARDKAKGLGQLMKLGRNLDLVGGVSVELPAKLIDKLGKLPGLSITPDAPVKMDGSVYKSNQLWPHRNGDARLWDPSVKDATIAVVDSGIDPNRADFGFGSRVVANVDLSTLSTNTVGGDGRGHGTFVAGIAAGSASGYAGAAPTADIVALDVMDDQGMALTSDVIAACNWILQNKDQYKIKVANFSLHSTYPSNFGHDPLDAAVEKLWFSGVTVVAAAGNYGTAGVAPVSSWRLGESIGTTAADAEGANPGTYKGGYTLGQPGARGDGDTAVAFDGTKGYVYLGSPASLQLNEGTVDAWFKTSGNGKYGAIVSTNGRYYIGVNPNGQLEAWDPGTGKDRLTGIKVADGAWHHVTMSFQSGVANGTKVYLDGNLALTTTTTFKGSGYVSIGSDGGTGEFFPGTIDDVAIYSSILSQAQIAPAGGPSGVRYAPGNDPFVITVGAVDLGTGRHPQDGMAPWSAYGYTYDGFWKPELSAVGRHVVGPVPPDATLPSQRPDDVVAPGYMELSGTSFAAPVVAGTASALLARHPDWTPDQVKGALMASAGKIPKALPNQGGVGEVNAVAALRTAAPPNPNLGLDRFVVADPGGGPIPVFDAVSWHDAAMSDVSWDSVSWDSVSWDSVSWDSVSWDSVSWDSVSWADVSWNDVSWADVSWADSAKEDAVVDDPSVGGVPLTADDAQAIADDPSLNLEPSLTDPQVIALLATTTTTSP